jgi:hypothetical protein
MFQRRVWKETKLRATFVERIDTIRKARQPRELGDQFGYHFIVFVRYITIFHLVFRLNLI